MRQISYCDAINEALKQEMSADSSIFIYGIGVPDHKKVFGSTKDLLGMFGAERMFDTPLCEEAMTGFAMGAAINGLKPIHIHIRTEFLLLAMNQIVNMISSYTYMTDGKASLPIVIRVIVGRGWGQGAQHSKSLHSLFAHIPGLKVVAPSRPYDAKGLLIASIRDPNPVIFFESRWLYWAMGDVPEESYIVPLGKANVLRDGTDVTVVATSWMCVEALHAADILSRHGIEAEVIDPRTISPLDSDPISLSSDKTHNLIVVDNDWLNCGFSAEIVARVMEAWDGDCPVRARRIGFAPTPCPTVRNLENEFYPNAKTIVDTTTEMLNQPEIDTSSEDFYSHERRFKGPF